MDDYSRRFRVVRVIDGDTILATTDLGYHTAVQDVTYRVARINTPELSGPDRPRGLEAKRYTEAWVVSHALHGDLFATSTKTDNWRRWLAEITCTQGHNLSDDLLASGHAVLYSPSSSR